MSLLSLGIKELSKKLKSKEVSPLEITKEYIAASEKAGELNLYITKTFDSALEDAKKSEDRFLKGESLSPLDGIPIAVKDNFLVKGTKTTNASKILSNFVAPYESFVTQKLKDAGCTFLGKLNQDEFAMGSSNLNSYFGASANAWWEKEEEKKVPGGSSGASASLIAARGALATLGTDTGGSIRQPASFCGVVGIKPTYGTCSRYGIIAFASSLDQAGAFTRSIEDNALVLQEIAGYDEQDSSMIKRDKIDYSKDIGKDIKGLKVGIPKEYYSEELPDYIRNACEDVKKALEEEGAEIVEVSLPYTEAALPLYYIIASAEASSNLSRYDGIRYGVRAKGDNLEEVYKRSRQEGWGEEVKSRILVGTYNLLDENFHKYLQAAKIRRLITDDFFRAFKAVDVLLTPTAISVAFGAKDNLTPMEMWYNDVFTVPINLAGLPALNVPIKLNEQGLPFGVQLISNYFKEDLLYQVGYKVEQKMRFQEFSNFVKKHNLF